MCEVELDPPWTLGDEGERFGLCLCRREGGCEGEKRNRDVADRAGRAISGRKDRGRLHGGYRSGAGRCAFDLGGKCGAGRDIEGHITGSSCRRDGRSGRAFGIGEILAVDADGNVIDGDAIMTILGRGFKERGALKSNTIVGTVMSNLGFMHAMKEAGIEVITTAVGDRYVLEKMLEGDFSLGGEQSGHLIMREFANTGDGILTALQLAQEVVRTGKPLAELASAMQRFPQVLINVPNVAKDQLNSSKAISDAVAEAEAKLADNGRVLLRASGTEPLVRVMVEASSDNLAQEIAANLAAVVKAELGS